jgi:DNA (cytosine-5)-methyltransferase 1
MRPFGKRIMEVLDREQKHVGTEEYPDDPYRATRHHDSMANTIRAIREHGGSWRDLEGAKD